MTEGKKRPIAQIDEIVPAAKAKVGSQGAAKAAQAIMRASKGVTLGGLSIKALVEEGRR